MSLSAVTPELRARILDLAMRDAGSLREAMAQAALACAWIDRGDGVAVSLPATARPALPSPDGQRKRGWLLTERARLAELAGQGRGIPEIAADIGRSEATVTKQMARQGLLNGGGAAPVIPFAPEAAHG